MNKMLRIRPSKFNPTTTLPLKQQQQHSVKDPYTITTLFLQLCTNLQEATQVHATLIKTAQIHEIYTASRLTEFYAVTDEGSSLKYAEQVFKQVEDPNIFICNVLIRGNLIRNDTRRIFSLYDHMLTLSVQPDAHTFLFLFKACHQLPRALEITKQLHAHIIKLQLEHSTFLRNKLVHSYAEYGEITSAQKLFDTSRGLDIVAWNSMLGGYAKNGDREAMSQLFDEMPRRDVVSWNTVISYHVRSSEFGEAIELFRAMLAGTHKADGATLVSVLTAAAHLGALEQGRWIHAYIDKHQMELDGNLGSALINMYAKCGSMEEALEVFALVVPNKRITDIWNSVICGFATNGLSKDALEIFSQMEKSGISPDAITFSGILNACSHGGLVDDGSKYFQMMTEVYKIEPDLTHYGCMVDLYSRAGFFEKAQETIANMKVEPDAAIWKALTAACRTHGNFKFGKQAGLKLIELDPSDHAGYVLLANIYAVQGKLRDAYRVRKIMQKKDVVKVPGCSSVEVDGVVHEFVAGDKSHPRRREINLMVKEMEDLSRLHGYMPDTKQVLLNLDEGETKRASLSHHSEKLAVAFGFISTVPGTSIRIVKNLRVCEDCHCFFKFLSRVYSRHLILRDSSRFHHFSHGSCSCNDFW